MPAVFLIFLTTSWRFRLCVEITTYGDFIMSDLERVHRCLRLNSIIFWIGILLMAIGLLDDLFDLNINIDMGILFLSSWLVLGGLKTISVIFGGLGTLFQPSYMVETTYSDGRRETSSHSGILGKLIGILIAFFIGPFVTCIHLIILIIKYLVIKAITKEKTSIIPSGLIIIIINLIFIAAFLALIRFAWFS